MSLEAKTEAYPGLRLLGLGTVQDQATMHVLYRTG